MKTITILTCFLLFGFTTSSINAQITKELPQIERDTTLSGIVLDTNKKNVSDVKVIAANTQTGEILIARTDESGVFKLADVKAGQYKIFTQVNNELIEQTETTVETDKFTYIAGLDLDNDKPGNGTTTPTVSDNCQIAGVVKDAVTKNAVSGITVTVKDGRGKKHNGSTQSDGSYKIFRVKSGKIQIWIEKSDKYRKSDKIEERKAEPLEIVKDVDFELKPN